MLKQLAIPIISICAAAFCCCCSEPPDHKRLCDNYLAEATEATGRKDFRQAKVSLNKALEQANQAKRPLLKAMVLQEEAKLFLQQGEGSAAEKAVRQSIDLYQQLRPKQMSRSDRTDIEDALARAQMLLYDTLIAQKRIAEAGAVLNQTIIDAKDERIEISLQGAMLDKLRQWRNLTGKPDSGQTEDLDSVFLAKFTGDGVGSNANNLLKHHQFKEAVAEYQSAIHQAEQSQVNSTICLRLSDLAVAEYFAGQKKQAQQTILQALHKFTPADGKITKAKLLVKQALIVPRLADSLQLINEAAKIDAKTIMAELYDVNGAPSDEDLDSHKKISELQWQVRPMVPDCDVPLLLSQRWKFCRNDHDQIEFALWCKEKANSKGLDSLTRAVMYETAARASKNGGQSAPAVEFSRQALKLREQTPPHSIENPLDFALQLSGDHQMIGNYAKAIEIASAQLSRTNPGDRIAQARLQERMGFCFASMNDLSNALPMYDLAFSNSAADTHLHRQIESERESFAKKH